MQLVTAYTWLDRFQLPPVPGGMMDQHPRFVEAVRMIEVERSEIAREEAEADERAHKARQNAAANTPKQRR